MPKKETTMERLWLGNIAPGTTDDELKELFKRYAPDLECAEIQREDGSGSRPAALVTFTGKKFDSLGKLSIRLNGMYWKERALTCSTMLG
jgi:RNA recognition motif-containing protein